MIGALVLQLLADHRRQIVDVLIGAAFVVGFAFSIGFFGLGLAGVLWALVLVIALPPLITKSLDDSEGAE